MTGRSETDHNVATAAQRIKMRPYCIFVAAGIQRVACVPPHYGGMQGTPGEPVYHNRGALIAGENSS